MQSILNISATKYIWKLYLPQQTDEDQNENPEDQFYLEESFGNLGPHVDIVILIVATSLVCFVVKDKRDNAADEDDDQAIQTGVNQEKHGSSQ